MKYSFAPMEGITLYPLRNTHKKMFGEDIYKYYTPFLTATKNFHFKKREKHDVMPEFVKNFKDYSKEIIPQLMAKEPDEFIWAARQIAELGYEEVNLNAGCPAATVTGRHKGSGLLLSPDHLDSMLEQIFTALDGSMRISVKTRLGFDDESEADALMQIYARYPLEELIIHARVRNDFYKGTPRIEAFQRAVSAYRSFGGRGTVCYNGDISEKDGEEIIRKISKEVPGTDNDGAEKISSIMIGRGLLSNPALVRQLNGDPQLNPKELKEYLETLYSGYEEFISEDRNVIFKMLEHWAFLHVHFKNSEKCVKQVRKSRSKGEYMAAVNNIFSSCDFI